MLSSTSPRILMGFFERGYQAGVKQRLRSYFCILVEDFQTLHFHKSIIDLEDISEATFMWQSLNQGSLPALESQTDPRAGVRFLTLQSGSKHKESGLVVAMAADMEPIRAAALRDRSRAPARGLVCDSKVGRLPWLSDCHIYVALLISSRPSMLS